MPLDDTLPPSRLLPLPSSDRILRHFPEAFGIGVDVARLDGLPSQERLSLRDARVPEPPAAVLLDRVLQLVPLRLLAPVKRIIVLPTRGTGRLDGYLNGIIRLSASEADVRRGDADYSSRFSNFTTTALHEIGHAIFQRALTASQRDMVLGDWVNALDAVGYVPAGEPSDQGTQHHFIDFLLPALLVYGRPPRSAAASRRKVAAFGLDLRRP